MMPLSVKLKQPYLFNLIFRYVRLLKRRLLRTISFKGRTLWISSPYCRTAFAGQNHPEHPDRLLVIEQALRKSSIWARLQKADAPKVTDIQLARVHSHRYLSYLENLVPEKEGSCIKVDEDTYLGSKTLMSAHYAAGAVVKAVDMVMRKDAKNAFCAVRPPGHHASVDKASGFCFINNVAVGVMHAIAEYRLKRIAIIDFDLHHGDGTEDIFQNDPQVMLLSSFEHPLYPFKGTDYQGSNPNVFNFPLSAGEGSAVFRHLVRSQWLPKLASFKPQMIFLSAGFDAHSGEDIGHLCLEDADFAWLTRKVVLIAERHAHGRIVSVLEGGYNLLSLSRSAKAHIAALVRAGAWF